MKKQTWARLSVVTAGALLLTGVGSAAMAADPDSDPIDINVNITKKSEPGVLALSVGAGNVDLKETGQDPTKREFTGTLPNVTVTDTRADDEIPADAGWVVLAELSNFKGDAGQPEIPASSLGWSPKFVSEDPTGNVSIGGDIAPGSFSAEELLYSAQSSKAVDKTATANADLRLVTGADVAPGAYKSTMTLTLIE